MDDGDGTRLTDDTVALIYSSYLLWWCDLAGAAGEAVAKVVCTMSTRVVSSLPFFRSARLENRCARFRFPPADTYVRILRAAADVLGFCALANGFFSLGSIKEWLVA